MEEASGQGNQVLLGVGSWCPQETISNHDSGKQNSKLFPRYRSSNYTDITEALAKQEEPTQVEECSATVREEDTSLPLDRWAQQSSTKDPWTGNLN